MNLRLLIPSLALICAASTSAFAGFWPLAGSIGVHDPTIIKEGSTWWVFNTGNGIWKKKSSNGLNWAEAGALFGSDLSWWRTYAPEMQPLDVWAPDLQKFGSRTWCFYCVSEAGKGRNTSLIGLTSCSSIAAGDWRDDGLVLNSKAGVTSYNALDPHLTVDAAGKPWLVFGSWYDGIHIVRLNASTMKPSGTIFSIAKRSGGIEGANVVYANGFYYLFVSIDRCCQGVNSNYKIAYGRSTSITGPYVNKNNVAMTSGGLTVLDVGNARWHGPGGQDVYKNGSAWLIARHAYDATDNGASKLLINDLFWDSAQWPIY